MTGLGATLLSILVIASFLLAGGGVWTILNRGDRKRGVLMLAAAAVMLGNVLVWTL